MSVIRSVRPPSVVSVSVHDTMPVVIETMGESGICSSGSSCSEEARD